MSLDEFLDFPFEIKTDDVLENGEFRGFGSTFGGKPDAKGDVVVIGAFTETLEKNGRNGTGVALLWQHNSDEPIGIYKEIKETAKGLFVVGQLNLEVQRGREAHSLLKQGAVRGLSIGFNVIDSDIDDEKDIRLLKKIDLWEVSLVTFPANKRAKITSVKALRESLDKVKTERELEKCLREAGISTDNAKVLVSYCKESLLREAATESDDIAPETTKKVVEENLMLTCVFEALKSMKKDLVN